MLRVFVAFLIAYFGARAIFAAFGFQYRVFHDAFDIGKLIIDFGVYAVLFAGSYWLIGRVKPRKQSDAG